MLKDPEILHIGVHVLAAMNCEWLVLFKNLKIEVLIWMGILRSAKFTAIHILTKFSPGKSDLSLLFIVYLIV